MALQRTARKQIKCNAQYRTKFQMSTKKKDVFQNLCTVLVITTSMIIQHVLLTSVVPKPYTAEVLHKAYK